MNIQNTMRKSLSAVLIAGILLATGFSPAQARSGEGETRLGKLEFEGDYVTNETAAKLREELRFQAAVQTYLWGFPIANIMALRDRHRAVGIKGE